MIVLFLCLLLFLVIYNISYFKTQDKSHKDRNIIVNRINQSLAISYTKGEEIDTEKLRKEYEALDLGSGSMPVKLIFYPIEEDGETLELQAENNTYLSAVHREDGKLLGFAQYIYEDSTERNQNFIINGMAAVCFFALFLSLLFIHYRLLQPFQKFSDYPLELAKGRIQDKLPETKNRYFGNFIWGMNMLSDKLVSDKKKMQQMEYDRQTMLTSIAHGVKTPVANIKLYANAIETGLYQTDGKPNESDAKVAGKIEKNAMDIEKMVTELINVSATTLCDYEPKISSFYLKELADRIEKEYEKRFALSHINYRIICVGNPLVNSDEEGLMTMLSQLIENAIKYGDGKSLIIHLEKQEDGFYFSVKNTGTLLSEHELPFVFKSFWRGSNAEAIEGSGIGLFVVKDMAHKLGGDVLAKSWQETGEMEVVIYF